MGDYVEVLLSLGFRPQYTDSLTIEYWLCDTYKSGSYRVYTPARSAYLNGSIGYASRSVEEDYFYFYFPFRKFPPDAEALRAFMDLMQNISIINSEICSEILIKFPTLIGAPRYEKLDD